MRQYLSAPRNAAGKSYPEAAAERDEMRRSLIAEKLRPLLDGYLSGKVALADFKSKIDGINKRHTNWGFKGIKGQMFFNMIVNTATNSAECDQELKAVLPVPTGEEMAKSRLRTFASYVKRLGDEHVEKGGSKHGRPKVSSVPFFVSYFWQIQDWKVWPVYYTNSVQIMDDLNLWRPSGDMAEDYILFKHIHEELAKLFTEKSGQPFDLYAVEHVFWHQGGNPYDASKGDSDGSPDESVEVVKPPITVSIVDGKLPDSYVPPIVAVLPQMATNDPKLIEAARASGTSIERAFEKSVNAAFTILGYDTQLLGQGAGRVPDGRALDLDDSYAILWDGKVRTNGYNMGTDDRTIREYIVTQSRELKRRRSVRNIYYVIVSSGFQDDGDDLIRMLKMDTDVNEVILMQADSLVAMVDMKLRDPHQVTLGPDGLQRLFTSSGILNSEDVREILG
jgi:hypothetical protein